MVCSGTSLNVEEARNYKRKREINGTPEYMSPEQLQFDPPSFKSDTWSLGIILYEMSSLELPFKGASLSQIIDNVCKKQFDSLPSHYSKEFCALVPLFLCKKDSIRLTIGEALKLPYIEKFVTKLKAEYQRDSVS